MNHFHRRDNQLWCEEVALKDIAEQVGTPFYCYSAATFLRHLKVFSDAFSEVPHLLCYSVKANSNLAILHLLGSAGAGFDIVSGGELYRAIRAGANPGKVVYSGVGKTEVEIWEALSAGILMFNVESPQELELINRVAGEMGTTAGVALRVNPDVDPQTHAYIATGIKEAKFGIDIARAREEYRRAASLPHIRVIGVDCHIGSQLTQIAPFVDAIKRVRQLVEQLRSDGLQIDYLDLGGGLGITYKDENPPSPADYAEAIIEIAQDLNLTLVFEPGRVIAGNAGRLVTQVLFVKPGEEKNFIIADAAMNDLARPSFYGSYHDIEPVGAPSTDSFVADLVGPICESGDFLAKDRELPRVNPGDLLAVASAGAYGFTMSSNYNSRPRVAEVLVRGDRFDMIRRRESFEDLVRGERIPQDL